MPAKAIEYKATDLAERVLADEPNTSATVHVHQVRVESLSLEIQQTIEAWVLSNPLPKR